MPDCPHPYDLQSFADGALGPEQAEAVRAHLEGCEACARRLAQARGLSRLLRAYRVVVPEGLLERILELVRTSIPVRKLSCAEALQMASEYLDDELDQTGRETLEAHLFACESCYREYVAMRTGALAMRSAPRVPVSDGLRTRILAAVSEDAGQPEPVIGHIGPARSVWRRVVAPAAAVAAVFLMTFAVLQVKDRPGEAPDRSPAIAMVTPDQSPSFDLPEPETAEATSPEPEASPVEPEPALSAAPEEVSVPDSPAALAADAGLAPSPRSGSSPVGVRPAAERTGAPVTTGGPGTGREPSRAAPRSNPATAPRPERVIEAEGPVIAMAPPPGTRPAGLTGRERTSRPAPRNRIEPDLRLRMPAVAYASAGDTGVTASHPLARETESRPSLPSGTAIAAAPPLTRPTPRPATRRPEPRDTELEQTPSSMMASGGWLPTSAGSSERLYSNSRGLEEELGSHKAAINKAASRERNLTGPVKIVLNP